MALGSLIAALGVGSAGSLATGGLNWGANAALQNDAQEFSAQQNALNRDFTAQQNQLARDFNERMSSTQYQRAIADLEKAGINPNAVFGSGGGASAPTVSASSASSNSPSSNRTSMPDLFNTALVAAIAKDDNFAKIFSRSLRSSAQDMDGWEEL